jgi:hypothetical protein
MVTHILYRPHNNDSVSRISDTELDVPLANFYEKALFVKTDVAVAPCGRVQLLSALRALCFYSHFQ